MSGDGMPPPPWMTPDEIDGLVAAALVPSVHGACAGYYHVALCGGRWVRTEPEQDVWWAVLDWLTRPGADLCDQPIPLRAFCRMAGGVEEELVPAWPAGQWRPLPTAQAAMRPGNRPPRRLYSVAPDA